MGYWKRGGGRLLYGKKPRIRGNSEVPRKSVSVERETKRIERRVQIAVQDRQKKGGVLVGGGGKREKSRVSKLTGRT